MINFVLHPQFIGRASRVQMLRTLIGYMISPGRLDRHQRGGGPPCAGAAGHGLTASEAGSKTTMPPLLVKIHKAGAYFVCGAKCQTIDILPRIFYDGEEEANGSAALAMNQPHGNTFASGSPALSPATIRSTAQRQMSSTGWWMVVRGGVVRQARSVSS